MKIRRTLLLTLGGSVCLAIMATAAGIYWSERQHLAAQAEASRVALATQFTAACRDALLVHDRLAAANAAASLVRDPSVIGAYCLDDQGRPLARAGPNEPGEEIPPEGRSRFDADGDSVTRWAKSFRIPDGDRMAVVDFSDRTLEHTLADALRRLGHRIAAIAFLVLLAAGAAAALLARRLTQPIEALAVGARALAAGRLGHRLDIRRRDELGDLAGDFNIMSDRLKELDEMKNTFVSNVTHELRSPLSAIESYVNFIVEILKENKPETVLDYLMIIRNNTARLKRFVNQVLDISKIDAQAVDLHPEELTPQTIFDEMIGLYGPLAAAQSLTLTTGPLGAERLWADSDVVHHALSNLLGNALKFTPAGGQITLEAAAVPDVAKEPSRLGGSARLRPGTAGVRLTVRDSGRGIAPEDQERIFRRFEQVKDAREDVATAKGTGLGLAIVAGLMDAHGGAVFLESAPGRGSAFSLFFPDPAGEAHG